MFNLFRKTDRYNELYSHLVNSWGMKSGFASVYLNEYNHKLSKMYDKGYSFNRQWILSENQETVEQIFSSLRDSTLASQAVLAYRIDLRSGRHVGTNIEKAIWAILLYRIDLVEISDRGFAQYLLENQPRLFPGLMREIFDLDAHRALLFDGIQQEYADAKREANTISGSVEKPKEAKFTAMPVVTSVLPSKVQPPLPEVSHESAGSESSSISKTLLHRMGVVYAASKLSGKGYDILKTALTRGDIPSITARKNGSLLFILVGVSVYPKEHKFASFVVDQFLAEAVKSKADRMILPLMAFNGEALTDELKSDMTNIPSIKFSGSAKELD